ncbi:unnamed protein product [Hydatigera taeniaeformis]|uniref:Uncharacterized protein n=1 Tax=Hydatigena taeniaeformis TaxID=6205 RepID=A0A0R3WM00_HYDTA|nr:unnamed protein product [Hydatigera taeniaeformis]
MIHSDTLEPLKRDTGVHLSRASPHLTGRGNYIQAVRSASPLPSHSPMSEASDLILRSGLNVQVSRLGKVTHRTYGCLRGSQGVKVTCPDFVCYNY